VKVEEEEEEEEEEASCVFFITLSAMATMATRLFAFREPAARRLSHTGVLGSDSSRIFFAALMYDEFSHLFHVCLDNFCCYKKFKVGSG
jgi:hypothetical protein